MASFLNLFRRKDEQNFSNSENNENQKNLGVLNRLIKASEDTILLIANNKETDYETLKQNLKALKCKNEQITQLMKKTIIISENQMRIITNTTNKITIFTNFLNNIFETEGNYERYKNQIPQGFNYYKSENTRNTELQRLLNVLMSETPQPVYSVSVGRNPENGLGQTRTSTFAELNRK